MAGSYFDSYYTSLSSYKSADNLFMYNNLTSAIDQLLVALTHLPFSRLKVWKTLAFVRMQPFR